jgi:hypothetical protein
MGGSYLTVQSVNVHSDPPVAIGGYPVKYLRAFPRDIVLFVGCLVAVVAIFIASYWSIYLMGYDEPHPGRVMLTVFLLLTAFVIIFATVVAMFASAFISFKRKQFRLGSSRVGLCLVLILVSFVAFLFLRWSTPFARGFRAKVSASVNIEQLIGWATDQFQENSSGTTRYVICPDNVIDLRSGEAMIDQIKPPDGLNEIGSAYNIYMYTDDEGKRIMDIIWGGGFGHWGLRIGASELNQYNQDNNLLEWKPRIWVLGLTGG